MSRKAKGGRGRDPFKDPSPYGTYKGAPGNAQQSEGDSHEPEAREELVHELADRLRWDTL